MDSKDGGSNVIEEVIRGHLEHLMDLGDSMRKRSEQLIADKVWEEDDLSRLQQMLYMTQVAVTTSVTIMDRIVEAVKCQRENPCSATNSIDG